MFSLSARFLFVSYLFSLNCCFFYFSHFFSFFIRYSRFLFTQIYMWKIFETPVTRSSGTKLYFHMYTNNIWFEYVRAISINIEHRETYLEIYIYIYMYLTFKKTVKVQCAQCNKCLMIVGFIQAHTHLCLYGVYVYYMSIPLLMIAFILYATQAQMRETLNG